MINTALVIGDYLLCAPANKEPRALLSLAQAGAIVGPDEFRGWYCRDGQLVICLRDGKDIRFPLGGDRPRLADTVQGVETGGANWLLRPVGPRSAAVKTLHEPLPIAALADCIARERDASFELAPSVRVDNTATPSRSADIALLAHSRDDFLSTSYEAEPAYLHLAHNATLFNGVTVLTRHGVPLWHTTYQAELRSRSAVKHAYDRNELYFPPRDFRYAAYHRGSSYLFNTLLGNYGHWHTQSLSSAATVSDLSRQGIAIDALVITLGWRFEAFRLATMPPDILRDRTIIDPAFPVFNEAAMFQTLLAPSFHRIQDYQRFHPLQIHNLRALFAPAPGAAGTKNIYISRADVGDRRTVTNETHLADGLAALGFDIVVPGRMSVPDQHALFRQARLIVAPHGGGMTNMLLAPPDAVVFELFHERQVNSWYRNMARILGFDYHYTVSPLAADAHAAGWSANFDIDVDHCIAYARSLM